MHVIYFGVIDNRQELAMTLTLTEAQSRLPELVHGLKPGEELTITGNHQPLAKVVLWQRRSALPFREGLGMLEILVEDDEHLKDFAEYMS